MARKKKVIEVKAEPEVWRGPNFVKRACHTCPLVTCCAWDKIKDYDERVAAKEKNCSTYRLGNAKTFGKLMVQTGQIPESLKEDILDTFFNRKIWVGIINQN